MTRQELRDAITYKVFEWNQEVSKLPRGKTISFWADDDVMHLIDEYVLGLIPGKPFNADKTQKPIIKEESGPMGGGMPGVGNWHLDTGHTASEQDAENARFECAKPYLDEIRRRAGIGSDRDGQ